MTAQSLTGCVPAATTSGSGPSALADLIARVEAAPWPDRELDATMYEAFECIANDGRPNRRGWTFKPEFSPLLRRDEDGDWSPTVKYDAPPYTASLDAALGLAERVLPGWRFHVSAGGGPATADACLRNAYPERAPTEGPTPALAIVLAVLRAKAGTTDRQPPLREDLPSPKASTSNEG